MVLNLEFPHNQLSTTTTQAVHVSPVVLLSIIDSCTRQAAGEQIIGVLLGYRHSNQHHIRIENSFPLKYSETVPIDHEELARLYLLHLQVNPQQVIVGWYTVGSGIINSAQDIHRDISDETGSNQAVYLNVDVDSLANSLEFPIKAFVSSPIGLSNQGTMFLEIPCFTEANKQEIEGCKGFFNLVNLVKSITAAESANHTQIERLEIILKDIGSTLSTIDGYVAQVLAGGIEANGNVGRYLLDTISLVPRLDPQVFEKVFNVHNGDLIMVSYLAELTKIQLGIAEKLNKI
ncbi:hypothetical protein HDV01_003329 [Terramyces sp. JEL0728]|nr:hypothetical protein HDV01_003329 [Terramyces sp. JEL0728]